jgi:hypothetical protein
MIVEETDGGWPEPKNTCKKLLGIHSHAASRATSDNSDLAHGAIAIDRHEAEPFATFRTEIRVDASQRPPEDRIQLERR